MFLRRDIRRDLTSGRFFVFQMENYSGFPKHNVGLHLSGFSSGFCCNNRIPFDGVPYYNECIERVR